MDGPRKPAGIDPLGTAVPGQQRDAAELLDWEQLFDALAHPTLVLDPRFTILRANRAAALLAGIPAAELAGRKCYEAMHGAAGRPSDCPVLRMQRSGRLEPAEATVAARGRRFRVACTPLADAAGHLERVIHIALDITEQERVERALRQSEERYRAFVSQSTEAIWLLELGERPIDTTLPADRQIDLLYRDARLAECNLVFARNHGFADPAAMAGMALAQFFPRLAPENVAYLRSFIERGHRISDVETRELDREQAVRYFLNRLTGHVERGRLLRAWGVKQEVTGIRRAAEEIRKLNDELTRRIAEIERLNRLFVGRELRMRELKERIRALETGGPPAAGGHEPAPD